MRVFQVGGCVRDQMLGFEPKDLDYVVVGATPQQMEQQGFQQVGADFPVFLHPQTGDEYALARKERKVDSGYYGFDVEFDTSVTLEDDLLRRDLTINAMAKCCDTGQFVDPFDGMSDLEQGLLRHVSDAFREDPVRVLRTARFAARYQFDVADDTMELMNQMVQSGELDFLVPERVQLELEKALLEPQPVLFFRVLEQCGALQVVMPELVGQVDNFVRFVQVDQFKDLSFEERFAAVVMQLDQQQRDSLFERVKAPKEVQQVSDKAAFMAAFVQQDFDAESVVDAFGRVDAFRRPDQLFSVGRVLECAPRCGSVRRLLDAFELARQVNFNSLSEQQQQTLQGPEIRQALREVHVERVKQVV